MNLTKKQARAIELRDEKLLEWVEIAKILGVKLSAAKQIYARGKGRVPEKLDAIDRNPGLAADVLGHFTDPLIKNVYESAVKSGCDEMTARSIVKAAFEKIPGAMIELREVRTDQLTRLLDHSSLICLEAIASMDHDTLVGEGVKDLSMAINMLLEKRALLRKEPTQRIEIEDRRHLDAMMVAIMDEAQRRGLSIDVNPATQERVVNDGDLSVRQRNKIQDGEIIESPV